MGNNELALLNRIQRLEYNLFGFTEEDLDGIRVGIRDVEAGKVRLWKDIKKDLKL